MQNVVMEALSPIRAFIDRTTMYKLVLYALLGLAFSSMLFGLLGLVYASALSQILSLALVVSLASLLSFLLAALLKIPANHESSIITALILFFLIDPAESLIKCVPIIIAITGALVSKYIIVYRKQHFVNAAAFGLLLLWLSGYGAASWWVATPYLLVPLVVAGLLVVCKIRKFLPVVAFLCAGFFVFLFEEWRIGSNLSEVWSLFFLSYPALFLGFFMLTEPFTMPPTKKLQIAYGLFVGFLSNTSLLSGIVSMTPEGALLAGNILFYPSTLRRKLFLRLESKHEIAASTWEFTFRKPDHFTFLAGQYLEWMLPHQSADRRGIRRYFTIASSPTESVVRLAIKIPTPGSSYKSYLDTLSIGQQIICSQLAGDFVLPKDTERKIGMIAGGIGITPFRSMTQYMADSTRQSDTVLYYGANTWSEVAYFDVLSEAATHFPLRVIPVLAKEMRLDCEVGYVSAVLIRKQSPDYLERMWYVSGPPGMVIASTNALRSLSVPTRNIVTDFFPGLA